MKILVHLYLFSLLPIVLILSSCAEGTDFTYTDDEASRFFPFVIPWDDSSNTVLSLASMQKDPAGAQGFIYSNNGQLFEGNDRIRFWGTNVSFGAAFPEKKKAENIALHMAKMGVNILRFHHMDMSDAPVGIWQARNPDRQLSDEQLDKLDYFIAKLKAAGIYSDINLLVSRPFNMGNELHSDIEKIPDWKTRAAVGFFDEDIKKLQKKYAKDLLTHVNPYTGNPYTREPAIAFIEINNENGLLHEYKSKTLDSLPEYYRTRLQDLWNRWLVEKYKTKNSLTNSWKTGESPSGPELLINGDFSMGLAGWNGESYRDSSAEFLIRGEGGKSRIEIDVTREGGKGWYVQLNQSPISIVEDTSYEISFRARADEKRDMDITLSMAHPPWNDLGFYRRIKLDTKWQRFTFRTPGAAATDDNARISFSGFGLKKGSVELDDISLRAAGRKGLGEGEDLEKANIHIIPYDSYNMRTSGVQKDWTTFLLQTEQNYWQEMYRYIKDELHAKPLVLGTIVGCSTPNIMAGLDLIDSHAYWGHPVFPNQPWDGNDWYIENSAMINNPQRSTVARLAAKRVEGKPFSVSEYNHPNPNTFESEAFFILSAYGGFQDWDAIMPFTYSHRLDAWNDESMTNYFDIDRNPVKMAAFRAASMAFRSGAVTPGEDSVIVGITRDEEYERAVTARPWVLVDAITEGLPYTMGLLHRIGIAVGDAPDAAREFSLPEKNLRRYTSETGEIVWDVTTPDAGFLTLDTDTIVIASGFLSGKHFDFEDLSIENIDSIQNGFASISIERKQDTPAGKRIYVITALGTARNTGSNLRIYPDTRIDYPPAEGKAITLGNNWGKGPVLAEGIHGDIVFYCDPVNLKVWSLDSEGHRKDMLQIIGGNRKERITSRVQLHHRYKTVWYEAEVTIGTQ